MKLLILTILLCIQIQQHNSARILGIIPTPAYSHQQAFHPIWKALAKRGHELLVVTSDPLNDPTLPNLKEIDIRFSYAIKEEALKNIVRDKEVSYALFKAFAEAGEAMLVKLIEYKGIQELIHNDTLNFDLVMFEYISPVFGSFALKFKCPSIGLMSYELASDGKTLLGNPQHPSVAPHIILPSYKNLNFAERLQSSIIHVIWPVILKYMFEGFSNRVIREYFGEDYPLVQEIWQHVDMVFTNANPVFKLSTPMAPNVVEYGGGVHIRDLKPLPLLEPKDGSSKRLETFHEENILNVFYDFLKRNEFQEIAFCFKSQKITKLKTKIPLVNS